MRDEKLSHIAIRISCPSCGASVSVDAIKCEYCNSPLVISEFRSFWGMGEEFAQKYVNFYSENVMGDNFAIVYSAGMCYLKLRLFDRAYNCFDKAISLNRNNSEAYFFVAISLLNGKKPFLSNRATIEKIEQNIKAAITIEPRGVYYYFWAYIKYDYFERKHLKTSPTHDGCLSASKANHVTDFDKTMVFDIIGVERPDVLN